MLTLEDLDALERSAEPVRPAVGVGAEQALRLATFERAAAPYRTLVQGARRLLASGRRIGPELENQLRQGARALSRIRETLGSTASSR